MSLVINNNSLANKISNSLTSNYLNLERSTQRLATGLRINSAADDAAGLAIRELQRADITALRQGVRNLNDAISMLQTTDGALSIIDEKLIRMRELAEQASTGTYDSVQRAMINSEFIQMASEIERIAQATDFNGIKILDGNFSTETQVTSQTTASGVTYSLSASQGSIVTGSGQSASFNGDPTHSGELDDNVVGTTTINVTNANTLKNIKSGVNAVVTVEDSNNVARNYTSDLTIQWVDSSGTIYDNARGYNIPGGSWIITTSGYEYNSNRNHSNEYTSSPNSVNIGGAVITLNIDVDTNQLSTGDSFTVNLNSIVNGNPTFSYTATRGGSTVGSGTITGQNGDTSLDFTFDIGSGNTVTQKVDFPGGLNTTTLTSFQETVKVTKTDPGSGDSGEESDIPDSVVKIHFGPGNDSSEDYYYIDKKDATLSGLNLSGVSIETQDDAQKALVTLKKAIETKDEIRAYYGAMQNRMENTTANVQIQAESLQLSESRISDTDIATEMCNFVRNQILTQSAVAMLAQAYTTPRMAMQLLNG